MRQFFKFMFASMLGYLLLAFIFILVFVIIIAGASKKGDVEIKDNSVLVLRLDKPIPDRAPKNPFQEFDFSGIQALPSGLDEYLRAIDLAMDDDRIAGIYLDVTPMPVGFATLEEIHAKLKEFKESGKFIYAYGEIYDQRAYYLASLADTILLNTEGALDFRGFVSEIAFLKGTLDKLDIEAQVLRGPNNKYKSAVEPLIYDKMSVSNREQVDEYLGDLWNIYLKGVSDARGLDKDFLNLVADSLMINTADDAVRLGFVDGLAYKDQVLDMMKAKLGVDKDDDIESVGIGKYLKDPIAVEKRKRKKKIAVIYATGSIEGGDGDDGTIGSERISKAIRKAREDSTIRAIVLRVNSPGGSALASEVIWREMKLSSETKPTIVSMGNVAASGGYYISCAADYILASPNTITGSIGVFGVIPNMEGFFNNKLGMTFDRVTTNKHSDYMTVSRPLDDFEEATINEAIVDIYETFIAHVAEGRNMDPAMVDSLARGRVWSGEDALARGLIDELGGMERAIEIAAERAGLDEYFVVRYPEQKELIEEIMAQFNTRMQMELMLQQELGPYYEHFKAIGEMREAQGLQARMPFSIVIR